MGVSRIRPSWKQGFARSRGESAAPERWDGFQWAPALGITGASVPEVIQHGPAATLTGAAAWNSEGVELFNSGGSDGTLTIPYSTRYLAPATFSRYSVELWAKFTAFDDYGRFWCNGVTFPGPFILYYRTTPKAQAGVVMSGDDTAELNNTAFAVSNEWQHIVLTVDGSVNTECKTYVNNSVVTDTSCSGTITFSELSLTIGADADNNIGFNGTIGLFGLYPNRVLTPAEIWDRSQDPLKAFRLRRRVVVAASGAPPAGLSIPIAMHHYKQMAGAN